MPLIIGLTGQAGSGKGTVGAYLRERYGAEFLTFSSYLRKTLETLALEPSRDNLVKLSETLRHTFGEDAISHAVARDAYASTASVVVVDGIRRIDDVISTLQQLPDFHLVSVDSDPRMRYERLTQRGEKSDEATMSWEDFLANEQRSTEQTIPAVMAQASIHLRNDGTLEEIHQQVDEMMRQLNPSLR
jgi:dephospho-CoA kinase